MGSKVRTRMRFQASSLMIFPPISRSRSIECSYRVVLKAKITLVNMQLKYTVIGSLHLVFRFEDSSSLQVHCIYIVS